MSMDFLIEMAWKSAAISGAALALVALLRSRSAADREMVLRAGVLLLLSLPAIAALFPALVIETAAPASPAAAHADLAQLAAGPEPVLSETAASLGALQATGDWNDPTILFLILYLGGAALVGGRLAAGLLTLRRWTAAADGVECPAWRAALARAESDCRDIRLLVSDEVDSPLSWGWLRPVILLDRDSVARPEDADAILAHEVAHIARGDWPSLLLSRIALALFWFNPLVWALDREAAQQAEEAADSRAAEAVEPTRYAQTLLDRARECGRSVPACAIASSEPGLSRRVKALLDGRFRRRSGSFWTVVAVLGCVAVAAPVAAIEFVPEAPEAPQPPRPPMVPPAPVAPAAGPVRPVPAAAPAALPPAAPSPTHLPAMAAAVHAAAHPPSEARRAGTVIDSEEMAAEIRASVAEAMRSAHAVRIDEKEIERTVRSAVATAMGSGAESMEHGAKGMEAGARNMRAEAAQLRRRGYREAQIRKAAERGERVTHEELLEAAEGLEEGARGMLEGAEEMRKSAAEMRRGG